MKDEKEFVVQGANEIVSSLKPAEDRIRWETESIIGKSKWPVWLGHKEQGSIWKEMNEGREIEHTEPYGPGERDSILGMIESH